MEKVVVEKKLNLNELKDKIKKEHKHQKKAASRAIWLTMGKLLRVHHTK